MKEGRGRERERGGGGRGGKKRKEGGEGERRERLVSMFTLYHPLYVMSRQSPWGSCMGR